MPVSYLTGKGVKEFAGMGADIYGKAINREMDKSKLQKICRRHHGLIQEKQAGIPIVKELPQVLRARHMKIVFDAVKADPISQHLAHCIFVLSPHAFKNWT